MLFFSPRLSSILCLAPLLLAGCRHGVATYPVSGTVRFDDGQPVRIGFIEFRCRDTGRSARARLDEAGAFSLGSFAAADGAPAGNYQIIIVQYFTPPPPGHVHSHPDHDGNDDDALHGAHHHDAHPDARVDVKFSSFSSTPLHAMVRKADDNKFNFVVTHPKTPLDTHQL
jgi:hypothetical protein